MHRVIRRWNQTGQKFAGADDIVTSGVFHGNSSILLWLLIGATYLDITNRISIHIARSVVTSSEPKHKQQVDRQPSDQHRVAGTLMSLPLCGTAFIFKLAFTAKDAPELTYGISTSLMTWVEALDLVGLARMVFGGIALCFALVVFAEYQRSVQRAQYHVKGRGGKSSETYTHRRALLTKQTWRRHSSTCLRSSCLRRPKRRTFRSTFSSELSSTPCVR